MSNQTDGVKMKQATTRAGKPKLRFPEFRDAGEWEIRRLGDLLLNHPDYGVNAPAVPYTEDLPAYLRITDISDEGYFLRDKKVSVDIDATDENYLGEGDIVLARTGASVGKSYKYRKEDGKLVFAGYLIRIKPDQKRIDSTFLFSFLSTKQYWNWVGVTSARSGQPGINGSEYATLSVPVPPPYSEGSLSEQQKIADCLSSIDELIATQIQKLDTLKAHKKGLLQQLFPAEGQTLPKLRFPEFKSSSSWKQRPLGEYADVVASGDLDSGYFSPTQSNEYIYPVYSNAVEQEGIYGYYSIPKYKKNSITITARGSLGVAFVRNQDFMGIGRLIVVSNLEGADPYFLKECWNHLAVIPQEVTSIPQLTAIAARATVLPIPCLAEQQKIADCLSCIDELIVAQTQKLDTLKAHKKGLMQQLFPSLDEVHR